MAHKWESVPGEGANFFAKPGGGPMPGRCIGIAKPPANPPPSLPGTLPVTAAAGLSDELPSVSAPSDPLLAGPNFDARSSLFGAGAGSVLGADVCDCSAGGLNLEAMSSFFGAGAGSVFDVDAGDCTGALNLEAMSSFFGSGFGEGSSAPF